MTTQTRQTTLRAEVIRADPSWPVTSRVHDEYAFGRRGRRRGEPHRAPVDPRNEGQRVFQADFATRGAYADEV
jgi:hypothetical protein